MGESPKVHPVFVQFAGEAGDRIVAEPQGRVRQRERPRRAFVVQAVNAVELQSAADGVSPRREIGTAVEVEQWGRSPRFEPRQVERRAVGVGGLSRVESRDSGLANQQDPPVERPPPQKVGDLGPRGGAGAVVPSHPVVGIRMIRPAGARVTGKIGQRQVRERAGDRISLGPQSIERFFTRTQGDRHLQQVVGVIVGVPLADIEISLPLGESGFRKRHIFVGREGEHEFHGPAGDVSPQRRGDQARALVVLEQAFLQRCGAGRHLEDGGEQRHHQHHEGDGDQHLDQREAGAGREAEAGRDACASRESRVERRMGQRFHLRTPSG